MGTESFHEWPEAGCGRCYYGIAELDLGVDLYHCAFETWVR